MIEKAKQANRYGMNFKLATAAKIREMLLSDEFLDALAKRINYKSGAWVPKVGDKVLVNHRGKIVHGLECVIIEAVNGNYTVDRLGLISKNLKAEHLEPIVASQTDHIADAKKMAPPGRYRLLDKSAKVEPRKAGDLYWSLTLGDWQVLSDQSEEDANRDDWPACRKIGTENTSETPNSSIPDPGPGYRLLSKDPPEPVVKGDDFFADCKWLESGGRVHADGLQGPYYYRRKIEPTKEQETQYREPTYADLANGPIEVEVCDDTNCDLNWEKRQLYAILPIKCMFRYIACNPGLGGGAQSWKHARVKVH